MLADIRNDQTREPFELSADELDQVHGGFLPVAAAIGGAVAEGAVLGFAVLGAAVAGYAIYKAATT